VARRETPRRAQNPLANGVATWRGRPSLATQTPCRARYRRIACATRADRLHGCHARHFNLSNAPLCPSLRPLRPPLRSEPVRGMAAGLQLRRDERKYTSALRLVLDSRVFTGHRVDPIRVQRRASGGRGVRRCLARAGGVSRGPPRLCGTGRLSHCRGPRDVRAPHARRLHVTHSRRLTHPAAPAVSAREPCGCGFLSLLFLYSSRRGVWVHVGRARADSSPPRVCVKQYVRLCKTCVCAVTGVCV